MANTVYFAIDNALYKQVHNSFVLGATNLK